MFLKFLVSKYLEKRTYHSNGLLFFYWCAEIVNNEQVSCKNKDTITTYYSDGSVNQKIFRYGFEDGSRKEYPSNDDSIIIFMYMRQI